MKKQLKNVLLGICLYVIFLVLLLGVFYIMGLYTWDTFPTKTVLLRILVFPLLFTVATLIIVSSIINKKNIKMTVSLTLISLISIFINIYFYNEINKVEGTIPSLSNDYFTRQTNLATYYKKGEKEKDAWMNDMNEKLGEDEKESYEELSFKSINVNLIAQNPKYPNGCEAASATMLLNFYNIDITMDNFINKYLPKGEVTEKNSKRYGPDPSRYYAGDPSSKTGGWGCFAPVIEKSINRVLIGKDYTSLDLTNRRLTELLYYYPVIIWVTTDYNKVTDIYKWTDPIKKTTYTYPVNSHAVVLVGADKDYYYINDPLKPEKVQKVLKRQLEESYDSMGRQAIAIKTLFKYNDEFYSKHQ